MIFKNNDCKQLKIKLLVFILSLQFIAPILLSDSYKIYASDGPVSSNVYDSVYQVVYFSDQNLENIVRTKLNIPTGDITTQDMAQIKDISIDSTNLDNLDGLKNAINLQFIELYKSNVNDISAIKNLESITHFDCYECTSSNLSEIENLKNISYLNLSYVNNLDLGMLSSFSNLYQLTLVGDSISDISNLSELQSLKILSLENNEVTNLNPISNLYNLEQLIIPNNKITDLSPLKELNNIKGLNFNSNSVSSVTYLTYLPNLESLTMNNNNIVDVSPLLNLNKLTSLDMSNNYISINSPETQELLKKVSFVIYQPQKQISQSSDSDNTVSTPSFTGISQPTLTEPIDTFTVKTSPTTFEGETVDRATFKLDQSINMDSIKNNTINLKIENTNPVSVIDISLNKESLNKMAENNMMISIQTKNASYNFPTKILSDKGITPSEISFVIAEKEPSENMKNSLVGNVFDFKVLFKNNDAPSEINDFGQYVTRTFTVPSSESNNFTPVRIEGDNLYFVPATIEKNGDRTTTTIYRNANSLYGLTSIHQSFDDINNHWAKESINHLANKLLVNGQSDTKFVPDSNITKAEFITLVLRALGVNIEPNSESQNWYDSYINTAQHLKLIDSNFSDNFNQPITRQEMSVIVDSAIKFTGKTPSKLKSITISNVDKQTKNAVENVIDYGIINGRNTNEYALDESSTRAEATVVIERMLKLVGFIN